MTIPSPKGEFKIDMTRAYRAEARQHEVATVTPHKAGELMSTFNRAWLDMAEATLKVKEAHLRAKRDSTKRRSWIMLNEVPERVGALRKLAGGGAAEFVEAVICSDPEYQATQELADQLEALHELLKEKKMFFAMAFSAVKAIFKEKAYDHSGTPLNGSIADLAEAGESVDEDGQVVVVTAAEIPPSAPPRVSPRNSAFGRAKL